MGQHNQYEHNDKSGMNPRACKKLAELRSLLEFERDVGEGFGIPQMVIQQVQSNTKENIIEH
ncbi:hypothetical protein D3C75_1362750 [compost metagenome]